MTWRVFRAGKLTDVGQQTAPLRADCTIAARIRVKGGVARRVTYTVTFAMNDRNGIVLNRRLTLRGLLVAQASQTSTCIPSHH